MWVVTSNKDEYILLHQSAECKSDIKIMNDGFGSNILLKVLAKTPK